MAKKTTETTEQSSETTVVDDDAVEAVEQVETTETSPQAPPTAKTKIVEKRVRDPEQDKKMITILSRNIPEKVIKALDLDKKTDLQKIQALEVALSTVEATKPVETEDDSPGALPLGADKGRGDPFKDFNDVPDWDTLGNQPVKNIILPPHWEGEYVDKTSSIDMTKYLDYLRADEH